MMQTKTTVARKMTVPAANLGCDSKVWPVGRLVSDHFNLRG